MNEEIIENIRSNAINAISQTTYVGSDAKSVLIVGLGTTNALFCIALVLYYGLSEIVTQLNVIAERSLK